MTTTKSIDFRVAGVSFRPGYPENLRRLHGIIEAKRVASLGWDDDSDAVDSAAPSDYDVEALLIRDPANEHDVNAIEVHVPVLGRQSLIGFVPATDPPLAAKFAPSMDKGDDWSATVAAVLIDPEHPDRPGIEVTATWSRPTP